MITAVPEDLATTNGAIEEDKSLAAEAHPFEETRCCGSNKDKIR